uniref:Fungal-type protein kinase domain-containing protein n=1 Tax=Psilocybe cubensis TaxID=181762 RepID=A0A8H7XMU9_PSICU
MAHLDGYVPNCRTLATLNQRPSPRAIELFQSPAEFLMAIHDAVESHGSQYIHTGIPHGNINSYTVWLGTSSVCSNKMGILMESNVQQKLFQSVNRLSETVLKEKPTARLDYVDDLESFYYLIAWLAMTYTDGGIQLARASYPPKLAAWAAFPESHQSVLEKRIMLEGSGFSEYFKATKTCVGGKKYVKIFYNLLRSLHTLLKLKYIEKSKGNLDHLEFYSVLNFYDKYLHFLKIAIEKTKVVAREYSGAW